MLRVKIFEKIRDLWSNARLCLSDFESYALAEQVARMISPRVVIDDFGRISESDAEFQAFYHEQVLDPAEPSYLRYNRVYMFDQLMKLVPWDLPGDTAECGVFTGISSYLICRAKRGNGLHHGFDSFEGISVPSEKDGWDWVGGDLSVAEASARKRLAPFDFVRLHKGWIPDTFPAAADRSFVCVHIDVDLYQPTLDSLAFFYPRLVPGALVILDDYGFLNCPGAKLAVDEFLADKPEQVISLPTGQAFFIRR